MKQRNKTKIFVKKRTAGIIYLIILILSISSLAGCASKQINPLSLPVTDLDKVTSEFPPTDDELNINDQLLLPLIAFKDPTVTDQRLTHILTFLRQGFEQNANIAVIPQTEVAKLLSKEENQGFQATNVADAIQLAGALNAQFVSQMQITIVESKIEKGVDQFKANINLAVFTTGSGQAIFQQDIAFDSQDFEKSKTALKFEVQRFFPLRGFILETRGDRQVAKISIGRSSGIKLNREFLIRDREVKSEIVNGVARKTVTYSPIALATAKVIKVMENESWISIDKKDQIKVKAKQAVFSLPEKKRILF